MRKIHGCLENKKRQGCGFLHVENTRTINMSNNTNTAQPEKSKGSFWVFLIPSLIGLFLFMAQSATKVILTIPVAILAKSIQRFFGEYLVSIIPFNRCFHVCSFVLSTIFKPTFITSSSFLVFSTHLTMVVGSSYRWCCCIHSFLPSRPWVYLEENKLILY